MEREIKSNTTSYYVKKSEEFVGGVLKETMLKYFDETKKDGANTADLNSLFIGSMELVIEHIKKNHNPEILKDVKKYSEGG